MSKCNDEAFQLAQQHNQMEIYADIIGGYIWRGLAKGEGRGKMGIEMVQLNGICTDLK